MGGSDSRPDHSRSMAQRNAGNSQTQPVHYGIQRLAIDQSGNIGSLYDATKDRLLQISPLNISRKFIALREEMPPPVISNGRPKPKNLLDMIGIDKELYLSICLKMTTAKEASLLVNYPFPTNEYTRFLVFHHQTKHSYLNVNQIADNSKDNRRSLANIDATHIVTGIQYGIHVVVVFQLSPKYASDLDDVLDKIPKQLATKTFTIEAKEKLLLDQLTDIKVFSNIREIVNLTKLADICQKINQIRLGAFQYPPMKYTLRSIRLVCPWYQKENGIYIPLNAALANQIELHLCELLLARKRLQMLFSSTIEQAIINYLKQQYEDIQLRKVKIDESFPKRMSRIYDLILAIRCGDVDQNALGEPVIDNEDVVLLKESCNIVEQRDALVEKVRLIDELQTQGIEYWNVNELISEDDNDLETIEQELLKKGQRKHIFCFSDKLKQESVAEWKKHTKELTSGRKPGDVVYADFSFCSCQLPELKILSIKPTNKERKSLWEESTTSATAPVDKKFRLDESNSSSNNFVNVLLLGECGVGKSTFINALINYLKFDTLEKACSDKLVSMMPVSFSLSMGGNQSEERVVKFGNADPNENHQHPGQSVTRQCRSYIVPLSTQTNMRLIDTPGIGDSRGLERDDLIMQHILSFINNLPHLNAICILLKPNESKLNIIFRSYFTRLIGFLGENIRNNIIFCFTNTRASSYAPGDTAPLLQKMLDSHAIKNIPLKKTNTFCFDNESFQYMIARQNGIDFDQHQKEEYKRSWEMSEIEAMRFLECICKDLKSYGQEDWQSIEHARWQINKMIRPMLETVRNTMRNVLLIEKTASKSFIQLRPSAVPRTFTICIECERSPVLLGEFWIIPDDLHVFSDQCDKCQCEFSRHSKTNYALKYEPYNDKRKPSINDLKANLDRLQQLIISFVAFFKYVVRLSKENDPILSSLNRIVNEEKNIVLQKQSNGLNLHLCDELKMLKKEYEKNWTTPVSSRKPMTLPEIYKLIKTLSRDSTINAQTDAIKQTQQVYMNEQEKRVS